MFNQPTNTATLLVCESKGEGKKYSQHTNYAQQLLALCPMLLLFSRLPRLQRTCLSTRSEERQNSNSCVFALSRCEPPRTRLHQALPLPCHTHACTPQQSFHPLCQAGVGDAHAVGLRDALQREETRAGRAGVDLEDNIMDPRPRPRRRRGRGEGGDWSPSSWSAAFRQDSQPKRVGASGVSRSPPYNEATN